MKNFFKNQDNIVIIIVSLVSFLAGCLAKHPYISLAVVLIADLFFFYPDLKGIITKDKVKKTKKFKNEKKNDLEKTAIIDKNEIKKLNNNISEVKNINETIKITEEELKDIEKKSSTTGDKMKKKKVKTKKKKNIFKIILILILTMIILAILAFSGFIFYIVSDAPKFKPENLYSQEPTVVYDANGNEIAKLGTEMRKNIKYDQLPEVLVDAIVATEDSKFFQHHGFDLSRFMVASVKQVLTSGGGGASTLTMQVVKNTFTSRTSSGFEGIKRKFTDIYMAMFQVEKKYTKKEIIEFYVNSNFLGSGAYGVEQASQVYFGKSAKDLNLSEAALIAGLFQAPTMYNPYQHPERAIKRRNQVLALMKRHNYITEEEYKIAKAITIENMLKSDSPATGDNKWQPFIDTVVEEVMNDLGKEYNPYIVSMKIYSTMDPDKQEWINKIMDGETYTWQNDYVDGGIAVEDVHTGAIVAVGAGRNRTGQLQFNNATQLKKQIGSTSKPLYDYGPGIEYENWSTYKLFLDEQYTYSDGTPIYNWDRGYNGLLTLRTALAQSRNIPALKAFQENKNSNIKEFVTSLGLHPEIDANGILHEAHSIGGGGTESPKTMAGAYAAFGNGGYYITPHSYTKVVLAENDKEIEKSIEKNRVMSEETAYMMTSLLQSSAQYGLGNQYNVNGTIYGAKTGTSNYDSNTIAKWGFGPDAVNDLWVNAVSPDYSISVWFGYEQRTEENRGYTSTSYTIGHRTLFQAVAKGIFKNGSNWEKPEGVVEARIEMGSSPAALASEYTPDSNVVVELFKKGTEPTEVSSKYAKLPDVTGLNGIVENNKLTLKWNGVTVKNDIHEAYTGSASVGNLIYKVYSKDSNGEKLIKDTTDTNITFDVTTDSASTYIVRTAYSAFTANMSDGATTTVSLANVKAKLTSTVVATTNKFKVGDKVNLTSADIKVMADSKDVTKEAKITITINNKAVTVLDTTKAGTYTVQYTATYNNQSTSVTRTITVENTSSIVTPTTQDKKTQDKKTN